MKPLRDQVLVRFDIAKSQTPGGLYIPDGAKEKPRTGVVVATGPGRTLDNGTLVPVNVQVGDRVCFSQYSGNDFRLDDVNHTFLKAEDIIAIID